MIRVIITKLIIDDSESILRVSEEQNAIPISSKSLVIFSSHYVEKVQSQDFDLSIEHQYKNENIIFLKSKQKIPGKFTEFMDLFGKYENIIERPSLNTSDIFIIKKIEKVPGFYIRYLLAYKTRHQLEIEIVNGIIVKSAYQELQFGDKLISINDTEIYDGFVVDIKDFYKNLDPSLPTKYIAITNIFTPKEVELTLIRDNKEVKTIVSSTEVWGTLWSEFSIIIGDLMIDEVNRYDNSFLYYSFGIKRVFHVHKVFNEKYIHLINCFVISVNDVIPVSEEDFSSNGEPKVLKLLKRETYGIQVSTYIYNPSA